MIGDPNARVEDWKINEINNDISELKNAIDKIVGDYNLNKDILDKLKTASKAFKYILAALGAIMGLTAIIGLLIPIRIGIADKKFNKRNPNNKKSSRKLIITSTIAGLLSASVSVGVMIYVFVVQGGL